MTADDLRALRRALRLTQAELAQKLYVQAETLKCWEAGRRKIPAHAIARLDELRVAAKLPELAKLPPAPPRRRGRHWITD